MKKIISIVLVLFSGILMNSCNQELLDIEQHGALSPDTYYANATDAQAEQLMAHIYREIYGIANWYGAFNDLSDNAVAGDANINTNPQDHPRNGLFTDLYRINYLCNLIIERMPDDSATKQQVHGEAYFWRGWAYTYLIRGWGTPPLVDHVLGSDELEPPNGDPSALWAYVDNSFAQAISLLPEKPGLGQQSAIGGRVTKGSARAMLGKAQVIRGDYGAAVQTLGELITSGLYELHPDFTELYHVEADWSDEYLWEFNADDGDQANFLVEGDNRPLNLNWRTENVKVPGGLEEQGYGGADFNEEFYNFMIEHDGKESNRYQGTIWDYEDIQDKFIEIGYVDGQNGLVETRQDARVAFWNSVPTMANSQGYFRIKMVPWRSDLFEWLNLQAIRTKTNFPGMRYAEVLLLYAEAALQSGQTYQGYTGLQAINEVRERAGIDPLDSYTLQDLKDEKRAELAYEGERYWDLVRWGDAAELLDDRGYYSYTFYGYEGEDASGNATSEEYNVTRADVPGAVGFVPNRDELFPFPYDEMLLNENLVQNPGWGE